MTEYAPWPRIVGGSPKLPGQIYNLIAQERLSVQFCWMPETKYARKAGNKTYRCRIVMLEPRGKTRE